MRALVGLLFWDLTLLVRGFDVPFVFRAWHGRVLYNVAICVSRVVAHLIERLPKAINVRSLPLGFFAQESCSPKIQSNLGSCRPWDEVSGVVAVGPMVYDLIASRKDICRGCLGQEVGPGIAHRWPAAILIIFVWGVEIKVCSLSIILLELSDSSVWRLGSRFMWAIFDPASLLGTLHWSLVTLGAHAVSRLLTFCIGFRNPQSRPIFVYVSRLIIDSNFFVDKLVQFLITSCRLCQHALHILQFVVNRINLPVVFLRHLIGFFVISASNVMRNLALDTFFLKASVLQFVLVSHGICRNVGKTGILLTLFRMDLIQFHRRKHGVHNATFGFLYVSDRTIFYFNNLVAAQGSIMNKVFRQLSIYVNLFGRLSLLTHDSLISGKLGEVLRWQSQLRHTTLAWVWPPILIELPLRQIEQNTTWPTGAISPGTRDKNIWRDHARQLSWESLGHFSYVWELLFVIISNYICIDGLPISFGIPLFTVLLRCHSGPQHILLRICMFRLLPLDFLLVKLSGPHFLDFLLEGELLFLQFLHILFILRRRHWIGVELHHLFIVLETHRLVKLGLLGSKILVLFGATNLFVRFLRDLFLF